MLMTSNDTQYTLVARTLHWLVAGLIISQYILAELAESAEHSKNVVVQLALLANHKSVGMTVLVLATLRIVWRLFHQPPPLPANMPDWQRYASSAAHWLLYGLIFALPVSGWLMSSSFGYSVSWFNVFTFPDLLSVDKALASNLNEIHEILGNVLLVLAALHLAAALKHHFIDKDDVLRRMASLMGWLVLLASIVLSIGLFGRVQTPAATDVIDAGSEMSIDKKVNTETGTLANTTKTSDLPVWQIDYSDSFIKFSGDQAGAPFDGEWQRWTAKMQFDGEQLNASQFSVDIDAASAFSNDEERDEYIAGPDFFDAEKYNQVTFYARKFSKKPNGSFVTDAQLSVKGLSKPVEFAFTTERTGEQVVLLGSATLDRMSWNIGSGDWADATWVGHDVVVSVRVVAAVTN